MIHIPLLEIEQSFILRSLSGINTVTFFNGDCEIAQQELKKRLILILKANPWLAGHLSDKNRDKKLELIYPKNLNAKEITNVLFITKNLNVDSNTPYVALGKTFEPYVIPNAYKTKNSYQPLLRIILSPFKNGFVLFVSLSHTIADGHTYYKILNMLSNNSTITTLNVNRKQHTSPLMRHAIENKTHNYLYGVAHILNVLRSLLCKKKSTPFCYPIDTQYIENFKETSQDMVLSTNDILAQHFSYLTQIELTTMAINFRGKLKDLDENDAGNYESALCFNQKNLQATNIRTILNNGIPYKSISSKLPHFFKGIFTTMGLVTNWAKFSHEIHIKECKETLHLPLTYTTFPYELGIIFRAKNEQLGMLFISKVLQKKDFEKKNSPFKKALF
jgi:hypothetical protein